MRWFSLRKNVAKTWLHKQRQKKVKMMVKRQLRKG